MATMRVNGSFAYWQVSEPRVVRDTSIVALDELAEEGQLDLVWHDVGRALDVALLHEELEVAHRLVLELLKPFV